MRYLFHSSLSLSVPSRAIMYDEALRIARQGEEVEVIYCGGAMTQCAINICGEKTLCALCKSYYRSDRRRFGKWLHFTPFSRLLNPDEWKRIKVMRFDYNNIAELKQLEYRGINIGYGVASAYISRSRNIAPYMDEQARVFFDASLRNAAVAVAAELVAVERLEPDHVYLYNGRFADSKPMVEIAQSMGIPYTTLEAVYGIRKNFRVRYECSSPFSMKYAETQIRQVWRDGLESASVKIEVGKSFFVRRRNAQYSGDKIYVANQIKGMLPEGWDASRHNVVIFNSSEDEFAAIGGEYEQKALFSSQLAGLQYIRQCIGQYPNVHVTLRIHPNLSQVHYSYVSDLYKLQNEQFTVVPGDSPISTYALLDAADTVVVFGSTMGAESVFWGKPTILLTGAQYYYLDICYLPRTSQELVEMLVKPLTPKDRLGAVQYGYFLMNEQWESPEVLDFDWKLWEVRVLGHTFRLEVNNWLKFLGSCKAYAVLLGVRRVAMRVWNRFQPNRGCRYVLPTKENSASL